MPKPPPLDERIAALRAEINAFIDERVEDLRKAMPTVPAAVHRNMLTRGSGCQCGIYAEIAAADRKGEAA